MTFTSTTFGRFAAAFTLLAGLILSAPALPARAASAPAPVEALIYSTMPSTAAHRPEMALDGDMGTYFNRSYAVDVFGSKCSYCV